MKRLFTLRLLQIAELAGKGRSMKEIAAEVDSTEASIKVTLSRDIYPHYGVKSQMGLIRYWMEHVELRGDCSTCILRQCHLLGEQAK